MDNEPPVEPIESASENHANATDDMPENEAENARFHLSPLSLIAKTIAGLRSLIFPLAAAAYAVGNKIGFIYLITGFAVIILITLGFTYWAWRRFSYQIGEEEIRIESGILSRNARSIPYERIQDVSLEQTLIPRLLGISAVKFETGGSEGDEGSLEYVSANEAENLRQLIRTRKSGIAHIESTNEGNTNPQAIDNSIAEPKETEATQDDIIYSMDVKRVFTLGIFNFSLVLFAVIAGAAQQLDFLLPGDLGDLIDYIIGSFDETSAQIKGIAIYSQIAAIIGLVIGLIVIGMLSGQVQTFLREYGFVLTKTDRGIRRRRGLITLTDVVMPLHRVQAVIIQTGPIRKRFGWHALKFTSLGSDTGKESSHMMAPLAKDEEYWPIAKLADIRGADADTIFNRSHISYLAAAVILSALFTIIILTVALILPQIISEEHIWKIAAILAWVWVFSILPIAIGYLSWRYHFHAMDGKQIYVRSGFWNQKMTILPMIKVQSVDLAQGPLSQYLNVADVKFGIAGGSGLSILTIHNIPIETAHHIRLHCIEAAKNIDFSDLIKAPKG